MTPTRSNLSLKRKRHEAASDVLKRPFVTPAKHQRRDDNAGSDATSRPAQDSSSPGPSPEASISSTKDVLVSITPQMNKSGRTSCDSFTSAGKQQDGPSVTSESDPNVANDDVARQIRRVAVQMQQVRGEIDTLERAASIIASRNDEHLHELIAKWRNVAQEAADELFPDVKKRVEANISRDAWCGTGRDVASPYEDTSDDRKAIEDGDSGQVMPTVHMGSSRRATFESREDKPFNMEVMLQMLNIDPTLIQYDVDKQMWI